MALRGMLQLSPWLLLLSVPLLPASLIGVEPYCKKWIWANNAETGYGYVTPHVTSVLLSKCPVNRLDTAQNRVPDLRASMYVSVGESYTAPSWHDLGCRPPSSQPATGLETMAERGMASIDLREWRDGGSVESIQQRHTE